MAQTASPLAPVLPAQGFPEQLRDWRRRRRLSQLALSLEAEVSQRHVAFLERGRAQPSRAMVMTLARALELPLAARNDLLSSAGFAPLYPRRPLDAEALAPLRRGMERLIARHDPYPAFVIDAEWRVVSANACATALLGPILAPFDGDMLAMFLESAEARAMVENWDEIGPEMLERLRREARQAGRPETPRIAAFAEIVRETCGPRRLDAPLAGASPLVATRLRIGDRALAFHSTIASFGGAQDLAVDELRIELFFPADAETEAFLEAQAETGAGARPAYSAMRFDAVKPYRATT